MARPITPTPKLGVRATSKFLERVKHDLNKPTQSVPTPRVANTIKKVMADARSRKK